MTTKFNIASVVKNQLCTGCGTCIALCPNDALRLDIDSNNGIYVPKINYSKCNICGICYQICPGHEVDFKRLNRTVFGKEPDDVFLGNYINCYTGYATDYDIRYNCSSGGIVTALLIHLLEERVIDGALVTRMRRDRPLEPEPFIARTREEIYEARGSKYCPVSTNVALSKILESKDGERFAVVGLPCHIHGIRKAEEINKKLKDKIVFHIGLFCNHAPNFWGTNLFLLRRGIDEKRLVGIRYRGEGWPGSMKIFQEDMQWSLSECWGEIGSNIFIPLRCTVCPDPTGELTDASFGDAWLPEYKWDKIGRSIVISRTKNGERYLYQASIDNRLILNKVSNEDVKHSQMVMLFFRKKEDIGKRLYKKEMKMNVKLVKSDISTDVQWLLLFIFHFLSKNRFLRFMLVSNMKFRLLCKINNGLNSLFSSTSKQK